MLVPPAANPMNLFDKSAPPDQVAALRELFTLLGNLGSTHVPKEPAPQPGNDHLSMLLGGLRSGS